MGGVTTKQKQVGPRVQLRLLTIREDLAVIDSDLANLYGVATKKLNQQVKRNKALFPADFVFRATVAEWQDIRRLRGELALSWGGRRYRPLVFTQQGVGMLASVLTGRRAIRISIEIMRAFVRQRAATEPAIDLIETAVEAAMLADVTPSPSRSRVTYFLQAGPGGPIKIGSTHELPTRMRALNLMSPTPLVLVGLVHEDIERYCHEQLAAFRLHGEWFQPHERVIAFIRTVATEGTLVHGC